MAHKFRLLPRALSVPHPERLAATHPKFDEIMQLHNLSVTLGQDGYTDPTSGDFVFNSKRLADEGKCCAMACRHCPFKR
jgi:hypothetical protein